MSLLESTARAFFGLFDEEVVYRPKGNSSNDRTIMANVIRRTPSVFQESDRVIGQVIEIDVRNLAQSKDDDDDGIGGISTSEIDTGGDQLVLAIRIGEDAEARPIKRILRQDEAMLQIELK